MSTDPAPGQRLHSWLRWLCAVLVAAGSAAGIAAGCRIVYGSTFPSWTLDSAVPDLSFALRLDSLGAVFLILICVVALPVAVYSIGYTKPDRGHAASHLQLLLLPIFLLSMILVVMAGNVFTFLLCWEAMALTSYFLVISEEQSPETLAAGSWYAGMSHAGFALIAAALLVAGVGIPAGSFESIRADAPTWTHGVRNVIFVLALLGFGSKAGLIPLHIWLPKAHPAAPSHVSALMSGVMIKMGVYGVLRIGLDLLGGGPPWWGGLMLVLGAASALMGVLYALMENDLKRLLAYSSVENNGIVFIGVGLAFIFRSYQLPTLATLSLVAALYHALNHASFKGLLFLGAGGVLKATGTRDMEAMGGLIKRLPQTAFCFFIGAMAISALPPLNGFVSEWMIFQSLMAGSRVPQPFVAALMALTAGVLALTGGLAAACFVKAFGISFLAMPRSDRAANAREVHPTMRAGMFMLAAACVVLGLAPVVVTPFLSKALWALPGFDAQAPPFTLGLALQMPQHFALISPLIVGLCLVVAVLAIPLGLRLARAERKSRLAGTWGCGRLSMTPRMEYTSTAFAEPLRRVFADLYRPAKDLNIEFHPESRYFVQSIEYSSTIRTWFEEYLYDPVLNAVKRLGGSGRWIQSGSVNRYLTYVMVAMLVLLVLARYL